MGCPRTLSVAQAALGFLKLYVAQELRLLHQIPDCLVTGNATTEN